MTTVASDMLRLPPWAPFAAIALQRAGVTSSWWNDWQDAYRTGHLTQALHDLPRDAACQPGGSEQLHVALTELLRDACAAATIAALGRTDDAMALYRLATRTAARLVLRTRDRPLGDLLLQLASEVVKQEAQARPGTLADAWLHSLLASLDVQHLLAGQAPPEAVRTATLQALLKTFTPN